MQRILCTRFSTLSNISTRFVYTAYKLTVTHQITGEDLIIVLRESPSTFYWCTCEIRSLLGLCPSSRGADLSAQPRPLQPLCLPILLSFQIKSESFSLGEFEEMIQVVTNSTHSYAEYSSILYGSLNVKNFSCCELRICKE